MPRVSLVRYRTASAALTPMFSWGKRLAAPYSPDRPLPRWYRATLLQGTPVRVADAAVLPEELADLRTTLQQHGIVATLKLPLHLRGAVIGSISADDGRGRDWPDDQVEFLQRAADVIVLARERQQAQERFRILFDESPDALILVFDQYVIQCNEVALEIFGFGRAEQLVGKHVRTLSPERQPCGRTSAELSDEIRALVLANGVHQCEWEYLRADGSLRPCEITLAVMRMDDRETMLVSLRDISERKQLEARQRASENRLLAQNQTLAEMTVTSAEHDDLPLQARKIMRASAGALGVQRASFWRYTQTRAGLRCISLYLAATDEFAEGMELPAAAFPAYFAAIEAESFIAAADAIHDPRTAEFSAGYLVPLGIQSMLDAPVHHRGQVVGVVCFESTTGIRIWHADESAFAVATANLLSLAIEVETRHQIERALAAARDTAEAATKAKSDFLANMSHEIRTPLNGVIGMLELLCSTTLDPEQTRFASVGKSSAKLLLNVINDILDFSKIEAGKLELETVEFDFSETIREVADVMSCRAAEKGLELVCDIAPELDGAFAGDPVRLQQIMVNLINNAIKFTENGVVLLACSATPHDETDVLLRCRVKDDGIGIPKDRQDRLFGSFSQVDSSTARKYGGTGLGLAISKELTRLMNGTIGVESEPGHGSTFWFTVQLRRGQKHVRSVPVELAGKRALIADDLPVNREILRRQLDALGMAYAEARNADEAEALLRQATGTAQAFDILLLDYVMPGATGADLARRIRRDPALGQPPIVILSSAARSAAVTRGEDLRIIWESKPIWRHRLVQVMIQALGTDAAMWDSASTVAAPAAAPASLAGTPILLVEDNEVNQMVAQAALTKAGYTVTIAANGKLAVDWVQRSPFGLVLMDCQMPEMDGFTATQYIRVAESAGRILRLPAATVTRLPIVALTASALTDDARRCQEAGMDAILTKPLHLPRLFQEVEQRLRASGLGTKLNDGTPNEPDIPTSPPDATPAAEDAVDPIGLLEMCMDDRELAVLLLQTLDARLEKDLAELTEQIAAQQWPAARSAAHRLKGAASNLCAGPLTASARAMEAAAETADAPACAAELAKLPALLIDFRAFVRDFVGERD